MNTYPHSANCRGLTRRLTAATLLASTVLGGCTRTPDVHPSPSAASTLPCDPAAEARGDRTLTDITIGIGNDEPETLDTLLGKNGTPAADRAWEEIKNKVDTKDPILGVPDIGTWVVNADVSYDPGSDPAPATAEANQLAHTASQQLGLPEGGHANDAYVGAAGIAVLHVDKIEGACG